MPYRPKYSTPRRPPHYSGSQEQDSAEVRQLCLECRQLTTKRHLCSPLCRNCKSRFCPGSGTCDGFCGSYPCCGCCDQTQTNTIATDVAHLPLESNENQSSQIQFPDLLSVMRQLIDFIFSEKKLQLDFERGVYRSVITAMGGSEVFANLVHNTVDPNIRALRGQVITVEVLHAIRLKQTSNPATWEEPHGGYLGFVTQALLPTYLRIYVGQSKKPKLRIPQHIREIMKGSRRSLHYYIINNGQGSRHANFIRLWTIPFPPRIDSMIMLVFENFLELVMCRAFQSLPASSLEEIFGPCPGGQYSGIGLNVMSPLLQGRSLSPYSRHKVVQLLSDSPDHEIREWALHRNSENHQLRRTSNSEELPVRSQMDKEGYQSAFSQAISTSLSLEEAPLIQAGENIWGPLQVHLVDPQSWFRSTTAKLQQYDSTIEIGAEMISPIGSSEASIGVVFETTPLHDYQESGQVISIPWGLRESGFRASNSLIWPFDLRRYVYIPERFQVQSFSAYERNILRDASQELIAGTRLRVIIICGDIEEIILPTDAKKVVLTLNNMAYNTWVEIQQKKIARIFIRAPTPLSELWASHGRQAYELTSIFKFVSAITDITIFSSFYECSMALALIVRRWADERDGKIPPASPFDLEPVLRVWLADKGFIQDESLLRLAEAVGGSLRYGLLVLTLSLPKPRREGLRPQRIPRSKVERRHVIPEDLLDSVRSIYNELCLCQIPDPQVIHDESPLIQAMDNLELIDDEECQDVLTTGPELNKTVGEKESPTSSFSFQSGLKLLVGNKFQIKGRERRVKRASFTIQHCTVSFDMEHQPTDEDFFWVKAELSPIGKKNPQAWATAAQEQDPGARLAFRIYRQDENGFEVWSTYAANDSWETICQANSLVDKFEGSSFIELCTKPRRYIYIDDRYTRLKREYPELIPFVGGAYTDDNMNVIPAKSSRRGEKHTKPRKRRLEDADPRAHKRARGPGEEELELKD